MKSPKAVESLSESKKIIYDPDDIISDELVEMFESIYPYLRASHYWIIWDYHGYILSYDCPIFIGDSYRRFMTDLFEEEIKDEL